MDGNLSGRINGHSHLSALNFQNLDRDLIADPDGFSKSAGQNQHGSAKEVEEAWLNDPGGDGEGCLEGVLKVGEPGGGFDQVQVFDN